MNLKTIECNGTLQSRLDELRGEMEKGKRQLDQLDQQRHEVRDTLLRISGAVQVLEELLRSVPNPEPVAETAPNPGAATDNATARAYG